MLTKQTIATIQNMSDLNRHAVFCVTIRSPLDDKTSVFIRELYGQIPATARQAPDLFQAQASSSFRLRFGHAFPRAVRSALRPTWRECADVSFRSSRPWEGNKTSTSISAIDTLIRSSRLAQDTPTDRRGPLLNLQNQRASCLCRDLSFQRSVLYQGHTSVRESFERKTFLCTVLEPFKRHPCRSSSGQCYV